MPPARDPAETTTPSRANFPLVSLIIPCRNEERFIGACLDSLLANDYPKDRLEILVVDGLSTDATRSLVEDYTRRYPFIRLLSNPKRIIPSALNIGIRSARGEVIMKIDAHTTYAPTYIRRCVEALQEYGADMVGGRLTHLPAQETLQGHAIAHCLMHPFGSLNSYFRIGSDRPRWVDAAAFGCWPRGVFQRIGLFREDLVRNSDTDFNRRLLQSGGRILLVPDAVGYYRSDATFWRFFRHNLRDGFWATYPVKFGIALRWRHYAPIGLLALFLGLVAVGVVWPPLAVLPGLMLGGYAGTSLWIAVRTALRERRAGYLIALPVAFGVRHAGYALGSIAGLVGAVISPLFWRNWLGRRSAGVGAPPPSLEGNT
ncbi:putative glycosyltransferase EpsJ [bacterium HR23]|nr:putative glycosyltransferase EpsJ [bacterium HR23]